RGEDRGLVGFDEPALPFDLGDRPIHVFGALDRVFGRRVGADRVLLAGDHDGHDGLLRAIPPHHSPSRNRNRARIFSTLAFASSILSRSARFSASTASRRRASAMGSTPSSLISLSRPSSSRTLRSAARARLCQRSRSSSSLRTASSSRSHSGGRRGIDLGPSL